jgi:hypothetical protein
MKDGYREYEIKKCTHCGKSSRGILGDKSWVYGRGENWGEADCHHCGARSRADILDPIQKENMKNNNHYWTWRKGRELLQFDSEETMNDFRPDEHSWWGKNGPGKLYAFLSPRLPNVDLIKNGMKSKIEKEGVGWGDPNKPDKKKAFKGAHWTVTYENTIKRTELKKIIIEIIEEIIKN